MRRGDGGGRHGGQLRGAHRAQAGVCFGLLRHSESLEEFSNELARDEIKTLLDSLTGSLTEHRIPDVLAVQASCEQVHSQVRNFYETWHRLDPSSDAAQRLATFEQYLFFDLSVSGKRGRNELPLATLLKTWENPLALLRARADHFARVQESYFSRIEPLWLEQHARRSSVEEAYLDEYLYFLKKFSLCVFSGLLHAYNQIKSLLSDAQLPALSDFHDLLRFLCAHFTFPGCFSN